MQDFLVDQQVTGFRPEVVSPSSSDYEALEFAVVTGDVSSLQALLSKWPQQGIDDERIDSLTRFLVDAIEAKDPRILELLLGKGIPLGLSHIQLAVEMKSDPILQIFLNHGWNINECIDWVTPPTLSLVLHDDGLTRWFLDHGADPNMSPRVDCTPLSIAVLHAPIHIIELLLSHGGTVSQGQLIHYAASREGNDRLRVLDLLLAQHAPGLNEIMYHTSPESFQMFKNFGLGTPLHLAAEKGHTDVVQYLLARGVNTEIRDSCGSLALDRAKRNEHIDIAEMLQHLSTAS